MFRMPVVVGVDGSEESLRATDWAAGEAVRRKVPLRIVSAPASLPPMRAPHVSEATAANALRGIAARSLGLALERAGRVARVPLIETGMLSGPPAVAVADCGRGASMLVLGARGAGGFGAMMLGSVSRYGADHAPCPVIVVREETTAVQREVAVGIRDPGDADGALAFAFEEAELRSAELLVVHAWHGIPPGLLARAGSQDDPGLTCAAAEEQLGDMLSAWREKYPTVKVNLYVVDAHPARVLASLSARADLIVIGKHAGPGPVVGSIQNVVLSHAHGPVAIVPTAVAPVRTYGL
jgi:nucleotide-binding universal stress UspA family protein